jgi:hypothetical protein
MMNEATEQIFGKDGLGWVLTTVSPDGQIHATTVLPTLGLKIPRSIYCSDLTSFDSWFRSYLGPSLAFGGLSCITSHEHSPLSPRPKSAWAVLVQPIATIHPRFMWPRRSIGLIWVLWEWIWLLCGGWVEFTNCASLERKWDWTRSVQLWDRFGQSRAVRTPGEFHCWIW